MMEDGLRDKFADILNQDGVHRIAAIPPPSNESAFDLIIWMQATDGRLSVQSVYEYLEEQQWN